MLFRSALNKSHRSGGCNKCFDFSCLQKTGDKSPTHLPGTLCGEERRGGGICHRGCRGCRGCTVKCICIQREAGAPARVVILVAFHSPPAETVAAGRLAAVGHHAAQSPVPDRPGYHGEGRLHPHLRQVSTESSWALASCEMLHVIQHRRAA